MKRIPIGTISDNIPMILQVLASSQSDVGGRDNGSKGRGEGKEGGNGGVSLTPVRSALVEWSVNLGGTYDLMTSKLDCDYLS